MRILFALAALTAQFSLAQSQMAGTPGNADLSSVTGVLGLANGGTGCAAPFAVNPQTTTYQVLATDFTCFKTITVASGTFTITLVASGSQPAAGLFINIVNYGSGVVTIARSGQNINGAAASVVLESASAANPTAATVYSDGTNYFADVQFGNPMTTAGDIITAGTTGLPTRVAVGAATTVLHGGASTPAYSNAAAADFGTGITARAALNNASAAAAAPTFSTTMDVLAYQTAEIPAYVFVTSDFTTSGTGTALEAITGLTWTMPGTTALNIPFSCHLIYHQNTAAVAVAFGTQNATTGPTNYAAKGVIYTSASVFAAANVVANTATTAVSVVSGTPSAITTNWNADLDGLIEQPSGTASVFTIRVSTATQGDTVTVKRGSFCRVG